MKISEMNNDQAADALIRIAPAFENICNDEELIGALEKIKDMGKEPMIKVIGYVVPVFVSVGLKRHKNDLYDIIGALTQSPVNRIGKMNFKETIKTFQDSYDEILRDFFTPTAIARKIAVKK